MSSAIAPAAESAPPPAEESPSPPAEVVSHQVNAAGTHPKGVVRWGYFLVLNGIAGAIAVAMFVGLIYADGIDPYMRGTYDWLLAHPGVTSFIAFSPLATSILVGWGYSQRARKRKAAAARAEALARAAAESTATAVSAAESPPVTA